MRQTIKIAYAEDHSIFRKGFSDLLKNIKDIKLVSECKNGKILLEEIAKTNPDIILMDVGMPEMNGIEATQRIREQYPNIPVIALSADATNLSEMLSAGAVAYLEKDAEIEDIREAIYAVYDYGFYYNKIVTEEVLIKLGIPLPEISIEEDNSDLSPKELEVLNMICDDYSNQEIATLLNVSIRTIEKHREKIHRKTGTHSPIGILKYAIQNKMFKVHL